MSRWITDPTTGLFVQLKTAMVTAIPALIPAAHAPGKEGYGPNGVWVAEQINRVPFEKLTEPYGVILIPSFPRMTGLGAANAIYNPQVSMYLVMEQTHDALEIGQYLEDLRDYMEVTPNFACGQVERIVEINWSDNLDANAILTAKESASRAGRVIASLWVGETITTRD